MPLPGYDFIHPLLDHDDRHAAYFVENNAPTASPTGQALPSLPLFGDFDHRQPWFLTATPLAASCAERIIPCFRAGREDARELEASLRQMKRKLALIATPEHKLPASGAWDYLLLPVSQARLQPPYTLLGLATRTVIVATEVQTHSDRDWALANACTFSTGEYLLTRNSNGRKADTTRQKMLKLLALIAQDADTAELDEVFRQESKLSYSLLRLVNSAAMAPRTPITCFSQAINMLGRRQLQRWLQLLVYADPDNDLHPNPLLYKAAVRGRLMELLTQNFATQAEPATTGDGAFMIGSFSLLDVLLNMSMPEILQQLPLAPAINDALAHHAGPAGKLLRALDAADRRNHEVAAGLLDELAISPEAFRDAQMQALQWAGRIHVAA